MRSDGAGGSTADRTAAALSAGAGRPLVYSAANVENRGYKRARTVLADELLREAAAPAIEELPVVACRTRAARTRRQPGWRRCRSR